MGDRGTVKSKGIQALPAAKLRYISALADPQIRGLLSKKVLQLDLLREKIGEVEGRGCATSCARASSRRRGNDTGWRTRLRSWPEKSPRATKWCRTGCAASQRATTTASGGGTAQAQGLAEWLESQAGLERQEEKMEKALDLAGDYVVITDVLQRAAGREKFGTTDEDPQAIACGMRSRRSANCGARI